MNNSEDEKLDFFSWQHIFIALLVFVLIGVPFISRFFGKEEIGAFFEAPLPYKTKYYVHFFPDKSAKNYKLVGDIYVDEECYGPDCTKYIQLETAYFKDASISFTDCYVESGNTSCVDNDGKEWLIEFYGEKVD